MLSPTSISVSPFTFRFVIWLGLNFMYYMRQVFNVIFFHMDIQLSQHYLLRDCLCPTPLQWQLRHSSGPYMYESVKELPGLFQSMLDFSVPAPISHCLNNESFIPSLDICNSKSSYLFFEVCLALLGPLHCISTVNEKWCLPSQ